RRRRGRRPGGGSRARARRAGLGRGRRQAGAAGAVPGMSARSAVPDLLLRIARRRRERLAEVRGRAPGGGALAPAGEAQAAAERAAGAEGEHDVPTVPDGEPALAGPRDNAFLAALTHRPAAPASPAPPTTPAIIAEVKMGSPRLGSLHGRVDPVAQAR